MTLVMIDDEQPVRIVPRVPEGSANLEQRLRDIIHAHPAILPVSEIEPGIGRVAAVCTELNLPGAGFTTSSPQPWRAAAAGHDHNRA